MDALVVGLMLRRRMLREFTRNGAAAWNRLTAGNGLVERLGLVDRAG